MAGEEAFQQSLIWVMWEISGDRSEKISVGEDRMKKWSLVLSKQLRQHDFYGVFKLYKLLN